MKKSRAKVLASLKQKAAVVPESRAKVLASLKQKAGKGEGEGYDKKDNDMDMVDEMVAEQ